MRYQFVMGDDQGDLDLLLGLSSRGQLEKCVRLCLVPEHEIPQETMIKTMQRTLKNEDVEDTVAALRACVRGILAMGPEAYFASLKLPINPKLQGVLTDIMSSRLMEWKDATLMGLSLPRLLHHDWTVHRQTASSTVQQMNVPVILVRLRVEGKTQKLGVIPPVREVDFELSSEALETMLDGMNKIKDQLQRMR